MDIPVPVEAALRHGRNELFHRPDMPHAVLVHIGGTFGNLQHGQSAPDVASCGMRDVIENPVVEPEIRIIPVENLFQTTGNIGGRNVFEFKNGAS